MPKFKNTLIDLAGQRFGRLLVIKRAEDLWGGPAWLCRCDCGTEKVIEGGNLKRGKSTSCGCLHAEALAARMLRHGNSVGYVQTPEYVCWQNMKERCNNPKKHNFSSYGGRGISVCDRWYVFENFLADMGRRPTDGHSIDRIDNNGNYEPGNCRWATDSEQQRNKRKKAKAKTTPA